MINFEQGPWVGEIRADVLAVPVFGDLTWGPGAQWAVERLGKWAVDYLGDQEFSGMSGQLAVLPGADSLPFSRIIFVGLGEDVNVEEVRRAAALVGKSAWRHRTVATTLGGVNLDEAVEATVFGFSLGQYSYDRYLSEAKPAETERVILSGSEATGDRVARATISASAVALARDLINEPAVDQSPEILAQRAVDLAEGRGIVVTIYDEKQIAEEGFGGLRAVGSGAANPPRMVVLDYAPEGFIATLALVGKGVVFDSGGLSLKPAAAMEAMKTDMSGAAAVLATVRAVADLGLPLRVLGITPLVENMPGGAAQRPGDIMRARNGKTIEILNTDAEGRLILADGLALAAEAQPDLIVDIATLTGACAVALGPKIAGLWANDDHAADRVIGAARCAGEKVWRMPLEDEYLTHVESSIADMKNIGDRYGSAISAALILSEFAGDGPWVHLDIAGPARTEKSEHYLSKGATGFGVRTLIALAEDLAGAG